MRLEYRRKYLSLFIVGIILSFVIFGCATKTQIHITTPAQSSPKISADNIVQIRELRFAGAHKSRQKNIYMPFLGGFAEVGEEIKCFRDTEYTDGIIDVVIYTRYDSTKMTKFKYIPIVGGMVYSLGDKALDFEWEGRVDFSLYGVDGEKIIQESFTFKSQHSMKNPAGLVGDMITQFVGGRIMAEFYPDEDALTNLGNEILKKAGCEIAKRMRIKRAASYFVSRTKARDGMNIKTYSEFIAKKKRLQEERKAIRARSQQDLQAYVKDRQNYFNLSNGAVMVFGVGVNKYEHFPDLKYAVSDCKQVVQLFKSRYHLSDDWAITLTDKDATAIKVIRFIERNVAKMLSKNDTFIFYFSGHGAPDVDSTSTDADGLKKYLLLPDSEPDALSLTAISLNDLAGLLKKLPCKRVIVFIDSCFAGMAGKNTLASFKGIYISNQAYKNVAAISGKGRVILAASAENQVSLETDELQAGVFTHYLLKGLNNEADSDSNQRVDIFELYKYVRNNVKKQSNNTQTPVFRGSLDRNIVF